jgi:transcriptional regulator with XRE-family HTH domain
VDTKWFKDRMTDRKINQTQLGVLLGLERSAISKLLSDPPKRRMTLDEMADIAKFLAVPYQEVLKRAGVKVPSDSKALVPVVGQSDVAGVVDSHVESPARIERPAAQVANLSAIRVKALRHPMDGWNAFCVPSDVVEPDAVGRLAVVAVKGGKDAPRYLGTLDRESVRGGWRVTPLVSGVDAHVVPRLEMRSAAPVLWIQTSLG